MNDQIFPAKFKTLLFYRRVMYLLRNHSILRSSYQNFNDFEAGVNWDTGR